MEHQSTEDENSEYEVHYSDGSYNTTDADKLYETFVDDRVEWGGVSQNRDNKIKGKLEITKNSIDIVPSDEDSKYISDESSL